MSNCVRLDRERKNRTSLCFYVWLEFLLIPVELEAISSLLLGVDTKRI